MPATDNRKLRRVVVLIEMALQGLDEINCDNTSETVYDELRALPIHEWRRTMERFCALED